MVSEQLATAPAYSTYTYTYNTAATGDRLTAYNNVPFVYDALGNPINYSNGTGYTFTWKKGRQLSTVNTGGVLTRYTYNADGIRIGKTVGSTVTTYTLDGTTILAEQRGSLTISYYYDANGSPIGMLYGTAHYLYEKNLMGDVVGIVNTSGTKVVTYVYDAWGNVISMTYADGYATLAAANPFRYRGYYYDTETGFYYLQSRYYDPATGRFLNADSQLNDSLLGFNQYAYCENNPVMYVDPSGTMPKWLAATMAIGFGVLMGVTIIVSLPAAACAASGMALAYLGATASTIATAGVYAVGTVTAVASAAYTADSMYATMTGESVLLETVFQGNQTAYEAGAVATAFATAGIGYLAAMGQSMGVCFVAGTKVAAEIGSIPIEEIEVGMFVYAYNPETDEIARKEVVNTFVRETDELVYIDVNGEKIITTPEHPFWVPQKGWTAAIHLRAGDRLQLLNGEYVVVEQVQHELLEAPVTVYNFEVEGFHTYFVTDSAILVHNLCDDYTPPKGGGGVSSSIKVGDVTVDFGHGGRHSNQAGFSASQVNTAIAHDVVTRPPSGPNAATVSFGYGGVMIEYRYFTRTSTHINVGTSMVILPE